MRTAFAVILLLSSAALTDAQPPKELQPRYGVKVRLKQYPQNTPKATLKSAVAAIEESDYAYLVGQLLDPKFVDDAIAERIKIFEPAILRQMAELRDYQRANPNKFAPEDRLPLDAASFNALVYTKAREQAFTQLVKDVTQKLTDDPQSVKDIRQILRDGSFADADPVASATHTDVKNRSLFFKRIGERWYLENRQTEEPKKEP
jgi:hypothetical protein